MKGCDWKMGLKYFLIIVGFYLFLSYIGFLREKEDNSKVKKIVATMLIGLLIWNIALLINYW